MTNQPLPKTFGANLDDAWLFPAYDHVHPLSIPLLVIQLGRSKSPALSHEKQLSDPALLKFIENSAKCRFHDITISLGLISP